MRHIDIPLSKIKDNPFQPRKTYTGIHSLAKNIKARGLYNPISVIEVKCQSLKHDGTPRKNGGTLEYVIVSGHRRFRAFKLLRWKRIPATIRKQSTSQDLAIDLAVENAQRQDFAPVEKAQAILSALNTIPAVKGDPIRASSIVMALKQSKKDYDTRGENGGVKCERGLLKEFQMSDLEECQKILKLMNVSENTCFKFLRLLDLPKRIQDKVVMLQSNEAIATRRQGDGFISVGQAYELSRIEDDKSRENLYGKIVKNGWNGQMLNHVVTELIETGQEKGLCKLGTSGRRSDTAEPYVRMGILTKKLFSLGAELWNFRSKLPLVKLSVDSVVWRAGLRKMRKSCEETINKINVLLEETEDGVQKIKVDKEEKIEFTITEMQGKSMYRFTFPKKCADRMGAVSGDTIVVKVDGIKRCKVEA